MKENFKHHLSKIFEISDNETEKLLAYGGYKGVRVNRLLSNIDTVSSMFDVPLQPTPFYKDAYYLPRDYTGIGNCPLHHAGAFYVQEPSAASVLSVVDAAPGERILDLCAAPGGKSTGIAAGLCGTGLLWSNEFVRSRSVTLLSNMERMGVVNAAISSLDTAYLCDALCGFFDKVLVDAPCSGEGMWRHNPLAEQEWSEDNICLCVKRQRDILQAAARAVRTGGRLIYSTCTYNIQENEENVVWFLQNHSDFVLDELNLSFGRKGLSGNSTIDRGVRRIFPQDGGEGHFMARFTRKAGGASPACTFIHETLQAETKTIVTDFFKDNFTSVPNGVLFEKNGFVFLVPQGMPSVRGNVLRYGLLIGEVRKNRLEPAHALFASNAAIPKRKIDLSLQDVRLQRFLHGEELLADTEGSGYVGIYAAGVPLGFGKQSGRRMTNRYPKGLRLLK